MKGRKALISVSNKAGVVLFAQELEMMGWEIISTGGTARSLREAGVKVRDISELTGFPEMLDGRVKTLHPKVHGGILGRRDLPLHGEQMQEHGIEAIDLVAVNLYPFPEVIARGDATLEEAVENIDIGGPAMIRAAAKNYRDVIVIVEPYSYSQVVEELRREGDLPLPSRYRLAVRAFSHTAYYDSIISNYLRQGLGDRNERLFPDLITFPFVRAEDLDSGDDLRQKAAFYREPLPAPATLARARRLQGKKLSFSNISDLQVAWELAREFEQPVAAAARHAGPCGAASAPTLAEACRKAFGTNPGSYRKAVLAFNRTVDEQTARQAGKLLPEAIVAPSFSAGGLKILAAGKNIRLLEIPLEELPENRTVYNLRKIGGGLLLREDPRQAFTPDAWICATGRKPTGQELQDLLFGLAIVRYAQTNAVAIVKRLQILGLGSGQMDQADGVKQAVKMAGQNIRGSVMACDACFLSKDGVEIAGAGGITAVVQADRSGDDREIAKLCEKYNIAMLFTGEQLFKH